VNDLSFYKRLIAFMLPQLEFLAPIIAEHYARKQGHASSVASVHTTEQDRKALWRFST
jgi:hypothetical protein